MLSDVHMPDMDGFKLLEHIALELDIPVMSESTPLAHGNENVPLSIMGLAVVVEVLARDGRVYVASRVASPDHDRFWSARRRGAPPRLGADDRTRPSERMHGRTPPKYLDLHLKKTTN